jgi:hypothetical protein
VTVVSILREMLSQNPQPKFSEIKTAVRSRCPWSRFDYAIFQKTYLPRFKRGSL